MKNLSGIALALLVFGAGGCVSVETPKYETVLADGDFEVRRYSPSIVAETIVSGDFATAGNRGFRRLADYIFGGNTSRVDIAMTAPVSQTQTKGGGSEKIAMTAPVGQAATTEGYVISFTMPDSYTRETLPQPKDPAVTIREIPSHRAAVITFSGTWSESRYQEKLTALRQWMAQQKLIPQGEPVFARYNPPWTPWFLRRNEILLDVSDF